MKMLMEKLHPADWAPAQGYTNAISVPASGKILFLSGQVGWDAQQRFPADPNDLVSQFDQAMNNIVTLVAEAGGKPEHICRITAFCIDKPLYLSVRAQLGQVWKKYMGKHYPCMSMIFVRDLLDSPAKIELEATAVIPA